MDENGTVLTSYAYNAFGEQVSAVATKGEQKSTSNRFLYAGEQYDETSGLYYLRARHYDVSAGRFTQEDTYLGDGRNLYAYVHSNPLKYVDPTGHNAAEIFDGDDSLLDDFQDKSIDGGKGGTTQTAGGSVNVAYSFRTQELLESHYTKHSSEFGSISQTDYVNGANKLLNSSNTDIMMKTKGNGDLAVYNSSSNEFAVKSSDGYIRTYFKPSSGVDYFYKQ